jgi:beta-mannosidase
MEPVWYRHIYKELPFIAEAGIHSFPSYSTLKKILPKDELSLPLPDLTSPEFVENFPGILNHFTEYHPERVPRMLSRASQIMDLKNCGLEQMCKATQTQAYEFYTTLVQATEENYPRSGGILPWVFKRHWATAGIQTVDGMGQPTYPYYAIQNTYRNIGVSLCLDWNIVAPYEEIPLKVKIFNRSADALDGAEAVLTVYTPNMEVAKEYRKDTDKRAELEFESFILDNRYTNKCFVICADLVSDGKSIARTNYFLKCTNILSDKQFKEDYRAKPCENIYFENGPWLFDNLSKAEKAKLQVEHKCAGVENGYKIYDICITNISSVPAYPVTVEVLNENSRFFASDNFILIKPDEEKWIRITCDGLSKDETADIKVEFWNSEE